VSVGLCLTHAVFNKDTYLKKFEIDGTWPIFGKPNSIYVDQGSDFKSQALKRGCQQNGIKIFYRRVGAPHLHGIVERLHGNLMKTVHSLPGTTFSNPIQRGEYDSSAKAVLTMRELEKWLIHVIIGQYHLDIHSLIMEPPISRFRRGIELLPYSPIQVTNEKSFLIDFLPVMKRTLQRHGFVIDHIQYFCNGLIPWISSRDKNKTFIIRRDPRDLSRIYVLHPNEIHYLEVPYRNMGRPSITIWEHKECIRRIKEKGLSDFDEATIFRTISEMRNIVENAKKETKIERKKRAIIDNIREKIPHTKVRDVSSQ
jgi:putative transposase